MAAALKRYFKKDLVPLLADLRLAIVLLLVIAVFSILGTVIEQGQGLAFYQENYPEDPALFGFLSWKVLLTAGLDHVYRTWWYLALLILFGSSLTACTFTRQITALRWFSRTWNFYSKPRQFEKMALSTELEAGNIDQLTQLLEQRRYKTFHQDGTKLYAHKGLVGRIGPIVVHASMLLILAGAMYGALTGFFAQEMVPSGNTFTIRNIFDAGPWAGPQIPKDWSVKVNRFWIDYSPEGRIDQFYSDLSVLDQSGDEVKRKTVWVNQPLRYRNVTLYQADWGIAGVRVKLNNSPVLSLPMAPIEAEGGKIWGTWVPTSTDMSSGVSLIAQDLQGTLLIYSEAGELIGTVREGMSAEVNGINLAVIEIVGSTGLQIKADPGVPLVYLGFGLLMVGVLMSYVSHSQVWALQDGDRLYIGGRTNRAQVTFERELVEVVDEIEAPATAEQVAA